MSISMGYKSKIFIAIAFCVWAVFCLLDSKLKAAEGPEIETLDNPWSFGEVMQGEKIQKTFLLKNSGDEELIIEEMHTCCGYLIPYISSWNIQPGATTEIKLEFDASRKPLGVYKRDITFVSNDAINHEFKVAAYANIIGRPTAKIMPIAPSQNIALQDTGPAEPAASMSCLEVYSRILSSEKMMLLDVREESEFSEKHIEAAINFPKSRFKSGREEIETAFGGIDKKIPLVVYCGGGFRSNYIAKKLREYGWNAFNLEGGITAWEKQAYPIIKGPALPASSEPLVINLEEAYENYFLLFKGNVVWIDARTRPEFEKGHIEGAINIPPDLLNHYFDFIPKDKEIVLYCAGSGCDESLSAGRALIKNGFKQARIKVFQEGFNGWVDAGYPVEYTRRSR